MSEQPDASNDLKKQEREPNKWRLHLAWVLGAVGLTYLVVAGLMFWNANTCISVYVDQSAWTRFWAGLTCMTSNEMGDMLAGMFAPLAFLGLIIAILLQGQDLELQRADQALTRKVMKAQAKEAAASAKALRAQANSAEQTAIFMGEQSTSLKEERMLAELAEAREAVRSALLARESTLSYRAHKGWDAFDARSILEFVIVRAMMVQNYQGHPFKEWVADDALEFRAKLLRIGKLTKKLEEFVVVSPSSKSIFSAIEHIEATRGFDPELRDQ